MTAILKKTRNNININIVGTKKRPIGICDELCQMILNYKDHNKIQLTNKNKLLLIDYKNGSTIDWNGGEEFGTPKRKYVLEDIAITWPPKHHYDSKRNLDTLELNLIHKSVDDDRYQILVIQLYPSTNKDDQGTTQYQLFKKLMNSIPMPSEGVKSVPNTTKWNADDFLPDESKRNFFTYNGDADGTINYVVYETPVYVPVTFKENFDKKVLDMTPQKKAKEITQKNLMPVPINPNYVFIYGKREETPYNELSKLAPPKCILPEEEEQEEQEEGIIGKTVKEVEKKGKKVISSVSGLVKGTEKAGKKIIGDVESKLFGKEEEEEEEGEEVEDKIKDEEDTKTGWGWGWKFTIAIGVLIFIGLIFAVIYYLRDNITSYFSPSEEIPTTQFVPWLVGAITKLGQNMGLKTAEVTREETEITNENAENRIRKARNYLKRTRKVPTTPPGSPPVSPRIPPPVVEEAPLSKVKVEDVSSDLNLLNAIF